MKELEAIQAKMTRRNQPQPSLPNPTMKASRKKKDSAACYRQGSPPIVTQEDLDAELAAANEVTSTTTLDDRNNGKFTLS